MRKPFRNSSSNNWPADKSRGRGDRLRGMPRSLVRRNDVRRPNSIQGNYARLAVCSELSQAAKVWLCCATRKDKVQNAGRKVGGLCARNSFFVQSLIRFRFFSRVCELRVLRSLDSTRFAERRSQTDFRSTCR